MKKFAKQIFWLAGLSLFVGLAQTVVCGYQAYVTDFTARALRLEGQDLERFQEARRQQLHLAENGVFIIVLQTGVIIACYRLYRKHESSS